MDGTFKSLMLCIGIEINCGANTDCPLRSPDGTFIRLDLTRVKLGDATKTWTHFLLQMLQLFYNLKTGKDTMIDDIPFQQYLGQVRAQANST